MSPPIDIDGSEIQEATIDGQDVTEITIDGQQAAELIDIPDAGLQHRYDFSDVQTTISSVPDLAGSADATSVNFSGFDTINGVRAGDFDGVDDLVDAPASFSQPFDLYAVFEPDALDGRVGTTPSNDFLEAPRILGSQFRISAGSNLSGGSASTNPFITVSQFDGGSSSFRVNGSQVLSGSAGTKNYNVIRLGGNTIGATADWSIGEVLIYDPTASGYSVADVESYLSKEWAITI